MSKSLSRLNIGNNTVYTKVRPDTTVGNITPITTLKLLIPWHFLWRVASYPQCGYY